MKLSAALLALAAAAVAAPLAAAQTCNDNANAAALQALQISNVVKRTTVKGGKRFQQVVVIKNTGATTVQNLELGSGPINTDLSFQSAKTQLADKKDAKPSWIFTDAPNNLFLATNAPISIPPKKALKVVLTYTAAACPTNQGPWEVSLGVQVLNEAPTCFVSATRPQFTIQPAKNCA